MHVLVTGGAGFIGSHLVERLIASGDTVTVIDSFDPFYPATVKRRNIAAVADHPRFALLECDIRDLERMDSMLSERQLDVVVHLAARAGVRPSLEEPTLYADVNVTGTVNVLELARKRGVRRFVLGSSSSVYGDDAVAPFSESERAERPISPYAATKRAAELIAHTYHHLYQFSIACLRFFTVYGPRQRPDLAIHKFARRMLEGRPIEIYGDGSMRRDFTYIDDIIDGIRRSIEWTANPLVFEVFNLGESTTTSVTELIGMLEAALEVRADVRHRAQQPGDVQQTFADTTKAQMILGYQPSTSMEQGLARFAEWLQIERVPTS